MFLIYVNMVCFSVYSHLCNRPVHSDRTLWNSALGIHPFFACALRGGESEVKGHRMTSRILEWAVEFDLQCMTSFLDLQ